MTGTARHDPEIADLASEREFLLTSLDDLEREHDVGGIDDATFEILRDDYTARAGAVLRAMRDGTVVPDDARRISMRRRILTIAGILLFAAGAGFGLASALGKRVPGGTMTGNSQVVSREDRLSALKEAARARPDDAAAQLAYAHSLDVDQQFLAALKAYDAVLVLEPNNVDALASKGWLLYRVAAQSTDSDQAMVLARQALDALDAAVGADPENPEAAFFRGTVLFRAFGEPDRAIPELQRFLVLAPDSEMGGAVRQLLSEAVTAQEREGSPVTTTTPTSAPTPAP